MQHNKISVLSDIEHVLKRPNMYIGSTSLNDSYEYILENNDTKLIKKKISYVPGFLTLFREIISNSIDEFVRTNGKYSNIIKVNLNDDSISVSDNGRGISSKELEVNGEKLPSSVVAFTQLKSGSNFNDDGFTIGMNGVGAACTNIFSKQFNVITITENEEKTILNCYNNLEKFEYKTRKIKSKKFGTLITYYPDFKKLSFPENKIDEIHKSLIKKILFEYSICYPKIDFKLNNKKVPTTSFKKYINLYEDNFEYFTFNHVDIGVFSGEHECISFVNGINTKRGGTHISYIINPICKNIREIVGKKYKEIKPGDVKNKLIFVINIRDMKAPRFDSQTKEQLSNSNRELSELINDINFETIAKKIKKNQEIMFPILETFKIKEEIKKRKELKNKEKKNKNKKIAKLIDANSEENRILYITEGQSALSSLISVREKNEGGYPLKGKVISPQDIPIDKLMKNQEINDILTALNLRLTSDDISNLNYNKIVIMTDQDEDGHGIAVTLINLFYTFWPDLIKYKHLYKAISPIIIAKNTKTNKKKEFYSISNFQNDPNFWNYEVIEHNKGLGSLSLKQYRKMMNTQILITEDEISRNKLDMVFGRDVEGRKQWLMNNQSKNQIKR